MADHVTVRFGGNLPGGEQWLCGVTVDAGTLDSTQSALDTWIQLFYTPLNAYWNTTAIQGLMCSGATLQTLVAYLHQTQDGPATLISRPTVTPLTATGAQTMPDQCAVVQSLRSTSPARNGRGRFYLPCLKASMSAGRLASPTPAVLAAATGNFLSAINAIPGSGKVRAGLVLECTTVVVDDVIDTQRRRANKLIPAVTANTNVT